MQAIVEPNLAKAAPEDRFQFERHGFFVADWCEPVPGEKLLQASIALQTKPNLRGGSTACRQDVSKRIAQTFLNTP